MPSAPADQATGLRRLFGPRERVTLGIAGKGAADVTVNLASALVRAGQRVLVIDATAGEAAAALRLAARFELAHVLAGDRALADTLLPGPPGVTLLPARRGLAHLAQAPGGWQQQLDALLAPVAGQWDAWLVNGVPPGSEDSPLILVVSPAADALTAAYACMKALALEHGRREFRVLVRRAASESAAEAAFRNVADAARRFLAARLHYCGHIPREAGEATADSGSPTARAFARLADALLAGVPPALPGAATP